MVFTLLTLKQLYSIVSVNERFTKKRDSSMILQTDIDNAREIIELNQEFERLIKAKIASVRNEEPSETIAAIERDIVQVMAKISSRALFVSQALLEADYEIQALSKKVVQS